MGTEKMSQIATQKVSYARAGIQMGLFFGLLMTIIFSFQAGRWDGGILPGIIAGTIFGTVMVWFAKRQASKMSLKRPDFGDEKIVLEGPANHFAGAEGVGGYLFLTDSKLFFLSHRFNIQNHELSIPLDEIQSVEASKTLGMVNNGLMIRRTPDLSERFVVFEHERWRDAILSAKANRTS
ncbi:hypothetical protein [Luteolibacter luteus]|uniref:GRAM domain-containing protein n=1 Tax=Luteolibacter luteus TaxID=2728835 RepID=A0A858RNK4_9BACT|nr:hypothetical protein [Luteolibacter luteus]QJE98597.1 hypothetical protein HHL09_23375 [Luteolibacter luteus]